MPPPSFFPKRVTVVRCKNDYAVVKEFLRFQMLNELGEAAVHVLHLRRVRSIEPRMAFTCRDRLSFVFSTTRCTFCGSV